ncbi:Nitric oxide reductase subunit B [Candidatus Filomicrobium marinum]|uniref:Nitric oxide reductase subunit B n=2 Tax=Filomicrobium TaxID=119044 RepID=A0A0D6JH77_9HYPH|nr:MULTISPECIES: cbb3-type cytochrome c oxidase subunit I [Filomicrobium]MCV0369511.1 cbb3-type cytochrome c oxidase subunit I [Filomicrobium sp.]CFX44509.1 Nitric oxide reductase subunit B [Candidatus Filomicrobium marinum]CPR20857.1 Nitric oxide reductase subunit B [Candidatus Filomicrobium marinum]SDP20353.1 nitric oxide reductase, NorB subunit apoprotein [Filomicrobium insigne]
MKYATQRVAYPYFICAMVLFLVQVLFGALAGTVYVFPNFLSETLPFNILRMIHTNALIVWLLMGFFGAAYYLIPEEAERDLESPLLAYVQLGLLMFGALAAVIGYMFGIHEGREFLEQPLWIKIAIVVVALIFLYNVSMTVLKGRRTAVTNVLLLGMWGIAVFWLFAFYNPANLALDKMYWWYIVHIWVEGVWELVMASVLAFLLIKMTGVDREVIEKWLYAIVGLALFSGLLGTGHHYYWIGTPAYWQWIGSVFGALEVLPFFVMVIFAFTMVWRGRRDHPNQAAMLWSLGCTVGAFFGAGVWGFMHTISFVNYYSHGTQVTAAHGHLAFYGAYVMLNLAIITYAMPYLRNRKPYNQVLNMWSFWIMSSGMAFMTFTLTFAGVVQTHLQRILGMYYMEVQDQLALFYWMRLGAGVFVVLGVLLYLVAIFGPTREEIPGRMKAVAQPAE